MRTPPSRSTRRPCLDDRGSRPGFRGSVRLSALSPRQYQFLKKCSIYDVTQCFVDSLFLIGQSSLNPTRWRSGVKRLVCVRKPSIKRVWTKDIYTALRKQNTYSAGNGRLTQKIFTGVSRIPFDVAVEGEGS